MKKIVRFLAILVIVAGIYQGNQCFSQNEATLEQWAKQERNEPKKLLSDNFKDEKHPVMFAFLKSNEAFGFMIGIENPKNWKRISYGLIITEKAPIGIFINTEPWFIIDSGLRVNIGFIANAEVDINMSNSNLTSRTFGDEDKFGLYLNPGLTYEIGRLKFGTFVMFGQQFPIVQRPMMWSWSKGWCYIRIIYRL